MKQYESYKLIVDERISRIPKQWMSRKLKHVTGFAYGDSLKDEDRHKGGEVPVFGSNGQVGNHSVANTKGPAIIIGRKGSYGKLTYTEKPSFAIDTTYYVDKTITKSNLRWLYYTLETLDLDGFTQDSAIPGLSRDFAYSKFVPLPGNKEQAAIAGYLDTETARIDQLITNKRQQIEKLNELRQITISRAVTQGLNPGAPMEDSGVEWIGQSPTHWELKRLKQVAQVRGGVAKGRNLGDHDTLSLPYIRVANVQDGYLSLEDISEITITPDEIDRFSLQSGDVLMNEGGDFDKLGRGFIWHGQIEPCLHQNHVFAVRPSGRVESEWLNLITSSSYAKHYFILKSKQSTNLASISSTNLKGLPILMPPEDERGEIIEYVQKESDKFQQATSNIESQIVKLEELRKITIHYAVTGKIKVTE